MFDYYIENFPDRLKEVNSTEKVVKFVLDMLKEFDIQLYFDPDRQEPDQQKGEDDLFRYCQVSQDSVNHNKLLFKYP